MSKIRDPFDYTTGAQPQRLRLIARMLEQRAEVEQQLIDVAYWNNQARRPGESPIDPDPECTLRGAIAHLDSLLKSEGLDPTRRGYIGPSE